VVLFGRPGAAHHASMRWLRHSPGFTLTAVLTLGAGIGAIVAMFSVYSRVVLGPVRVGEPETLVSLYAVNPDVGAIPPSLSWPRFEIIRRSVTTLTQVGAYGVEYTNLSGGDGLPEQLRALRVSGDFFAALRLVPARGRVFDPEHDLPNGPAVCILSHELWQLRFGGRSLIGTTIQLDGRSTEVIGILPPRMSPPWADRQIFLPRVFEDSGIAPQAVQNGASYLDVVARLRPGATIEQAAAELQAISRDYAVRFAGRGDATNVTAIRPLVETVVGRRRPVFRALVGAVAAVLLIACANVAALFLSRLVARQREIAIRQALGATRAVIVGQLLGESFALASAAGVIGLALAAGLLALAGPSLAAQLPPGLVLQLDGAALVAAIGVVFVSALLVGLVPALHVTRGVSTCQVAGIDRGSSGVGTRRLRGGLVVIETALSVLLLVVASLLLASLYRLQTTSPGFDPSGVAAAHANLTSGRYPTPERQAAFFIELVERLRRSPQVTAAAVTFGLPAADDNYSHQYAVQGRPVPPPSERARAGVRTVTEDYFAVMRVRLVEGRLFTDADRAGAPAVCIVNESLARRLFGGDSAIGRVILRGRNADQAHQIVGVVADVKTYGLRAATPDEIFYPFRQLPRANVAIVARTAGSPSALEPVFRAAAASIDPLQPIAAFAPMEQRMAGTIGVERVMAAVTAAFAVLALVLASIGLYAVLAHGVAMRRTEIGIRMAIGAERPAIVKLILMQGMRLVAVGIGAGLGAAVAVSGLVDAQLYGVGARDPRVYLVIAGLFAAVGALASLAPALRASRVDPLVSLRAS
jgi:putative ABC transport system permease protein